jgi:hypothetical protein
MLPLYQLDLVKDSGSPYGLSFKLQDDCQPIHAEQLSHDNSGKTFSTADNNGMPIFDKKGSRTLYTRKDGLSRLCLGGGLDAGSYYDDLAGSGDDGRVVLVRSEAASENFSEKLRLQHEKSQIDLSNRYERALRVLEGKE